jgi:hypothetical protein
MTGAQPVAIVDGRVDVNEDGSITSADDLTGVLLLVP